MNLNKTMHIGRLTRDPEPIVVRDMTTGANIGLACNDRKLVDGDWRDSPTYLDLEIWDRAEGSTPGTLALNTLKKGMLIYAEGRLKLDQWEDRTTGQKRSKLKIVVSNWLYLEKKETTAEVASPPANDTPPQPEAQPQQQSPTRGRGRSRQQPQQQQQPVTAAANGNGDDVPF